MEEHQRRFLESQNRQRKARQSAAAQYQMALDNQLGMNRQRSLNALKGNKHVIICSLREIIIYVTLVIVLTIDWIFYRRNDVTARKAVECSIVQEIQYRSERLELLMDWLAFILENSCAPICCDGL